MSWARFSYGDVYIYESDNGIECCGCILPIGEERGSITLYTVLEVDSHIRSHRDAGHFVPESVDACFREWIAEYPERQQQAILCGIIW